jgi:hypothetical protein
MGAVERRDVFYILFSQDIRENTRSGDYLERAEHDIKAAMQARTAHIEAITATKAHGEAMLANLKTMIESHGATEELVSMFKRVGFDFTGSDDAKDSCVNSCYASESCVNECYANESCVNECVVCLGEDCTHAFVPCGHKVVCSTCAPTLDLKECPVCRQSVSLLMKIY